MSRSWLYTQPDIRDQIQRLRAARNGGPAHAIPAGQRATDASLNARLTRRLATQPGTRRRERPAPPPTCPRTRRCAPCTMHHVRRMPRRPARPARLLSRLGRESGGMLPCAEPPSNPCHGLVSGYVQRSYHNLGDSHSCGHISLCRHDLIRLRQECIGERHQVKA
jgi:hypothetical protein